MDNNLESDVKYAPYKEIAKKKALDYYYVNREMIREKNKNRYQSLSPEQKQKRQEASKRWYNNQSPEKKEDLRQKARKYQNNRYHNLMVEVKLTSMLQEFLFCIKISIIIYPKLCFIIIYNIFL